MAENDVAEQQDIADGTRTAVTASDGALRRGATAGYRWLLLVFLLAGVVQIFLAGLGVFHLHDYGLEAAAGDSALAPHRELGFIMADIAALILLLALIARPGARKVILAAVLVLLSSFGQPLLAGLGDGSAVYGGLHALDGLLIIGIAGYLFASALALRRTAGKRR
jgi:hypothetical protein